MLRFVTFVDGSNLDGVLKHLNLRVDDYGSFYRHVFEQSVHYWGRTFAEGSPWPTAQHSRIYWYVVGKMDEWDLNDPKAEARLKTRFELNPRLRDSLPRRRHPPEPRPAPRAPARRGLGPLLRRDPRLVRRQAAGARAEEAVLPRRAGRHRLRRDPPGGPLEGRPAAPHGQREGARHEPGRRHGRAPGDLRHRAADLGRRRRHPRDQLREGPVEARRRRRVPPRRPADFPAKGASSRLKIAADFVVQVYESDLIRRNLAYRSEIDYQNPAPSYGPGESSY